MTIEVTVNAGQFENFLEDKGEIIMGAIRAQMQKAVLNALSYIKDEKLSGQVLNQRSGNLKRSGDTRVQDEGDILTGLVLFGSAVPIAYAAIHNYGGTINIPAVEGKLMVFERDGATVFTTRHRAFTVTMPERNYLESSLTELEPEINAGFQTAIAEAANP